MNMKKLCFTLLVIALVVSSCGRSGSSNKRAKSLCDCAKEVGLDKLDMDNAENVAEASLRNEQNQEKIRKCVVSVMKGMQKDMKGMNNDKAKAKYTRELLKGFIDSDCADAFFESLPYEEAEAMLTLGIESGSLPFGFGEQESSRSFAEPMYMDDEMYMDEGFSRNEEWDDNY